MALYCLFFQISFDLLVTLCTVNRHIQVFFLKLYSRNPILSMYLLPFILSIYELTTLRESGRVFMSSIIAE